MKRYSFKIHMKEPLKLLECVMERLTVIKCHFIPVLMW